MQSLNAAASFQVYRERRGAKSSEGIRAKLAGNGYGEAAKKVTMGNYKHKSAVRTAFMLLIALGLIPLLPMLISGRWNWWEA